MWEELKKLPLDPIFEVFYQFLADKRADKINLSIGLYSAPDGQPFVFDIVKKAFLELDRDNFYYQPISGIREFLVRGGEFLFGEAFNENILAMQATCGGTQACRLFADLLAKKKEPAEIYVGLPTWGNYFSLFKNAKIETFEHLSGNFVNAETYFEKARKAPLGAVFIVQGGAAHNPCGLNLSPGELDELIEIINERDQILYVDMAYFGFGNAVEADRNFLVTAMRAKNLAVGVSYSKNAALYEHRCGALYVKCADPEAMETQMQQLIRESVSTPPGIGQEIMLNLFKNHYDRWLEELEVVRKDINFRREALVELLPENFAFLNNCRGMFGLLPLNETQVLELKEKHGIYLLRNGRINFSGIILKDLKQIAKGLIDVL